MMRESRIPTPLDTANEVFDERRAAFIIEESAFAWLSSGRGRSRYQLAGAIVYLAPGLRSFPRACWPRRKVRTAAEGGSSALPRRAESLSQLACVVLREAVS